MTFLASQRGMLTRQWEVALVVVKGNVIPTRRVMAERAIRAELSIMSIILLMTGVTI